MKRAFSPAFLCALCVSVVNRSLSPLGEPFTTEAQRTQRKAGGFSRLAIIAFFVTIALFAPAADACPVCYGDPNAPMTRATNNGIMFLLAIVGLVQVGFVALFWTFWKRTKELRRKREQFRLMAGGLK